jgi:hypothetical protein
VFFEALCQFLVGLSDSAGGRTRRSSNRAFTVPPLPLERPRRQVQRFTLSHDQRRVAAHYFGYVDPARLAYAQLSIGAACGPWSGVLGNPFAILHSMFCRRPVFSSSPPRRERSAMVVVGSDW